MFKSPNKVVDVDTAKVATVVENGDASVVRLSDDMRASSGAAEKVDRVVVIRYFLDRPGFHSLEQTSARLWKNPPILTEATDIWVFLARESICAQGPGKNDLLVEVFLDKFKSFMLLEVCAEEGVSFDFSQATIDNPITLNLRLTDKNAGAYGGGAAASGAPSPVQQNCNTSPVGLFAFSMTVALETTHFFGKLVDNSIASSFVLTWGPYAFFVSGLLQLIVGMFEITRNNVYGATAFMAFGSFWLANGLKLIISNYFPEEIDSELLSTDDPGGNFVRQLWILGFVCVLFKQTLAMNKLTTGLISTLIVFQLFACLAEWSLAAEWIQMILGWVLSVYAFFMFAAELTNEVYHKPVFDLRPWHKESSVEAFGTAGRPNMLQSKAIELRTVFHKELDYFKNDDVRAARSATNSSPTSSKTQP